MKRSGELLTFTSSFVHMSISTPLPSITFLLAIILGVDAALKGPPRAQVKELKQIAYFGKDIKLQCPIDGNPSPMIEWKKDGEIIDYSWIRMKASKKQLRIRAVTDGDTGLYICKGINGFGSEQIRIELIAIDSSIFPHGDRSWEQSPPIFTPTTRNLPTHYHISPGASWRVSCSATGTPQPDIFWLRDGQHHKMLEYSRGYSAVVKDQVTQQDSGIYTCKAKNLLGEINKNFTLSVSSLYLENPSVTNTGPRNLTIYEGETASMQCKAKSDHLAHIKWLKLLENREKADEGRTIKVGDSRFLMIDDTEQIKVESDEYLNGLTILSVVKEDEGTYICFVTSSRGGFNYQPTHLKVLKARYKSSKSSSQKDQLQLVILLISCCISVLLLMVLIAVCIVRRRNGKSGSTKTAMLTHLPIIEHTKQGLNEEDSLEDEQFEYPKVPSPSRYGFNDCNSRSLPVPPPSHQSQDDISRSSPPISTYHNQDGNSRSSPSRYPDLIVNTRSSPTTTYQTQDGRSLRYTVHDRGSPTGDLPTTTYQTQDGRSLRYTVEDRGSLTGASENQYDIPFSHVRSMANRNQAYFSPPSKKAKRSFGIKIKNSQPESFSNYKQYYL